MILGTAVTSLPACALENPSSVRDSTGAELGWECDNGRCDTVQETFSPLPPDCGPSTRLLVGAGPIAVLCAVSQTAESTDEVHPEMCRPLVCRDELDCPQWSGREYACIQEVCQVRDAAGWRLDRVDATALCLYDLPRHESCSLALTDPRVQELAHQLEEHCPDDRCQSLPSHCLQP